MASSASGQYAAKSVFGLATRAGKMERYCPPGTNLRSCPSSLYLDAGKEGMIHLLVGSYVQKPDSGFFSDWSRNNTPETLRSYWLSYFNKTSGQKVRLE